MTIFEWINQILTHKKPWDSFNETDQKTFSPFIIHRWLSMDEEFIEVVNYFQKYAIGTLEPREVYKWYSDFLPKGNRFNKYIKSKKDKKYDIKRLGGKLISKSDLDLFIILDSVDETFDYLIKNMKKLGLNNLKLVLEIK